MASVFGLLLLILSARGAHADCSDDEACEAKSVEHASSEALLQLRAGQGRGRMGENATAASECDEKCSAVEETATCQAHCDCEAHGKAFCDEVVRSSESEFFAELPCSLSNFAYGDRFIQIGEYRFGEVDATHFSISHSQGKTIAIFRSDGLFFKGPRTDFSTFTRTKGAASGISYGERFIQIGGWRLGDYDGGHFSISHENGNTAMIYRNDGLMFPGPRTDFGTWSRPAGTGSGISYGEHFVQIGDWRIGAIDGVHASIGHKGGKTASIFRGDGIYFPGPRDDFGCFTRPVQCETPPHGLAIKIISGSGLLDVDSKSGSGTSDPFVIAYIKGPWGAEELCRTEHVDNSIDPKWYVACETEKVVESVEFQVWDKDFKKADDTLGSYTWTSDQKGFIAERRNLKLDGTESAGALLLTIIPTVERQALLAAATTTA